jgi:hypothetical protein
VPVGVGIGITPGVITAPEGITHKPGWVGTAVGVGVGHQVAVGVGVGHQVAVGVGVGQVAEGVGQVMEGVRK